MCTYIRASARVQAIPPWPLRDVIDRYEIINTTCERVKRKRLSSGYTSPPGCPAGARPRTEKNYFFKYPRPPFSDRIRYSLVLGLFVVNRVSAPGLETKKIQKKENRLLYARISLKLPGRRGTVMPCRTVYSYNASSTESLYPYGMLAGKKHEARLFTSITQNEIESG